MTVKIEKVPTTTSPLVESANRRVVDLTEAGVPEIPRLGMNQSPSTTEGSIFHRHAGCMEITYCVRGSVKFDCGGRAYPLFPGGVFASMPADAHRLRVNPKGAKVYWIFLKLPRRGERIFGLSARESKWIVDSFKSFPRKSFVASTTVLSGYERLFEILDAEKAGSVESRLKLRTAALDLVIALVESGIASSDYDEDLKFRAVIDRMRRDPQKLFPMDKLVKELDCSLNTIISRFHRFTGLPPQAFLMKCRIHRAIDLLKDPSRRITEIADELGFASSQHFATRFRQETGKTPREWRRG